MKDSINQTPLDQFLSPSEDKTFEEQVSEPY